jgi:thioredoxin reductase (NADPH)
VEAADIPVVITPTEVLRRSMPGRLAEALGPTYQPVDGTILDVAVVGAGPAGLAAAVHAASEGAGHDRPGRGQARRAGREQLSLIENYLGFPSGISGTELTDLPAAQAGVRDGDPLRPPPPRHREGAGRPAGLTRRARSWVTVIHMLL